MRKTMLIAGILAVAVAVASAVPLATQASDDPRGGCSGKLYFSGDRMWVEMDRGTFSDVVFGSRTHKKKSKYEMKLVPGKVKKLVEVPKGKWETHRWVFKPDPGVGGELPGLGSWVEQKLPAPVWVTYSVWEEREVDGMVLKRVKVAGSGWVVRPGSSDGIVRLGPGRAMVTSGSASGVMATVICGGGQKLRLKAEAPAAVDPPRAARETGSGQCALNLETNHVGLAPREARAAVPAIEGRPAIPKRDGDTFPVYLQVSDGEGRKVEWKAKGADLISSTNDHATVRVKDGAVAGTIIRVTAAVTCKTKDQHGLPVETNQEQEFSTAVVDANRR